MSLFNTLFNVGIARRVGLWALIQALPDEDSLRGYLRAAYMGLAGVIIGSVLTGSAIAAGIAAAYNFMIKAGWEEPMAMAATAGFTLAMIIVCFTLASRWFIQLASIKDEVSLNKHNHGVTGVLSSTLNDVADGFIQGLTSKPGQPAAMQKSRRIKLIS